MGGRNDLDNTLFTGGRESTPVVLEKRLERLLGLPLRMLSGRLLARREGELEIDRLLAPERTFISSGTFIFDRR